MSRFVARWGTWEYLYGVDDVLEGKSAAGGTLLDIGANLGYVSFVFAAAKFTVHSIEPLHENVVHIRQRYGKNLTNIRVMHGGLGKQEEELSLAGGASSTSGRRAA